eukprot:708649-Pleurochrysis_carterae.AAC.1
MGPVAALHFARHFSPDEESPWRSEALKGPQRSCVNEDGGLRYQKPAPVVAPEYSDNNTGTVRRN